MAIEQGIVIKFGDKGIQTAWVETRRSSACESCSVRDSCNQGAGTDKREVEALNDVGARIGDRIQIAVSDASLLKATFLLYLFPVLCMLAAGIGGHFIAIRYDLDTSLVSLAAAVTALVTALSFVRIRGGRMAAKAEYRPRIIRILGRAAADRSVPEGLRTEGRDVDPCRS